MRSKDPCGVFSELTHSYDTFLSTIIKKHWGRWGDYYYYYYQCVYSSLEENEGLYGVCMCVCISMLKAIYETIDLCTVF